MRILFIHPNYHSGGAEIAGNWPPAWVAYLTGALNLLEVVKEVDAKIVTVLGGVHATFWKAKHSRKIKGDVQAQIMACGGGKEQLDQAELDALTVAPPTLPKVPDKTSAKAMTA